MFRKGVDALDVNGKSEGGSLAARETVIRLATMLLTIKEVARHGEQKRHWEPSRRYVSSFEKAVDRHRPPVQRTNDTIGKAHGVWKGIVAAQQYQ